MHSRILTVRVNSKQGASWEHADTPAPPTPHLPPGVTASQGDVVPIVSAAIARSSDGVVCTRVRARVFVCVCVRARIGGVCHYRLTA